MKFISGKIACTLGIIPHRFLQFDYWMNLDLLNGRPSRCINCNAETTIDTNDSFNSIVINSFSLFPSQLRPSTIVIAPLLHPFPYSFWFSFSYQINFSISSYFHHKFFLLHFCHYRHKHHHCYCCHHCPLQFCYSKCNVQVDATINTIPLPPIPTSPQISQSKPICVLPPSPLPPTNAIIQLRHHNLSFLANSSCILWFQLNKKWLSISVGMEYWYISTSFTNNTYMQEIFCDWSRWITGRINSSQIILRKFLWFCTLQLVHYLLIIFGLCQEFFTISINTNWIFCMICGVVIGSMGIQLNQYQFLSQCHSHPK